MKSTISGFTAGIILTFAAQKFGSGDSLTALLLFMVGFAALGYGFFNERT